MRKITKNMEINAYKDKHDEEYLSERMARIKQFDEGGRNDSGAYDRIFKLAPKGFVYAFISRFDPSGKPNTSELDAKRSQGWREVDPTLHPELQMESYDQGDNRIKCARFRDFYVIAIEDYLIEHKNQKDAQYNEALTQRITKGVPIKDQNGQSIEQPKFKVEREKFTEEDVDSVYQDLMNTNPSNIS